jgi:hypothetical protein
MNLAGRLASVVIWLLRHQGPDPLPGVLYSNLMGYWPDQFSNSILLALAPMLITARFARVPMNPSPDDREWVGRAFALLSILWASVFRIIPLFSG